VKLPDKITVRCCACSGVVSFVVPKSDSDYPTMYHTMPYCGRFDSTNTADAIVTYLRDCGEAEQN